MESAVRFFNIKRNLGKRSRSSLSPNHSQGTLHGWQNNVLCGIQWLCRQIPGLMIYLRATCLQILLKSYSLIPILYGHPFLRFPYCVVLEHCITSEKFSYKPSTSRREWTTPCNKLRVAILTCVILRKLLHEPIEAMRN